MRCRHAHVRDPTAAESVALAKIYSTLIEHYELIIINDSSTILSALAFIKKCDTLFFSHLNIASGTMKYTLQTTKYIARTESVVF